MEFRTLPILRDWLAFFEWLFAAAAACFVVTLGVTSHTCWSAGQKWPGNEQKWPDDKIWPEICQCQWTETNKSGPESTNILPTGAL